MKTAVPDHLKAFESGARLQDLEAELLERRGQVQALECELDQTKDNLAEKVCCHRATVGR